LSDPAVNIPSGHAICILVVVVVVVVVIESFVAPTSYARYREDTLKVPLQSEQA